MSWHEDHSNLIGLATWLESESLLGDASEAIAFFEKPWKWDREYHLWVLWKSSNDPDWQEHIVVSLIEEKTAFEALGNWETEHAEPEPLSDDRDS